MRVLMGFVVLIGLLIGGAAGAQDDVCSPEAVIASFAQVTDLAGWLAQYSACPVNIQRGARSLATGYQLLLSEYLPFASADNPYAFSAIWKWYQGSAVGLLYTIDATNNSVALIASNETDQRDTVTSAPLLAMPTSGDLTAQVRVFFDPLSEDNGAGIGIRAEQDPNQWIRITRTGDTIEVSATQGGVTSLIESVPYEEAEPEVYLKIQRVGTLFNLSFSVNGLEWRDLVVGQSVEMPAEIEVYLTTFSPQAITTYAEFREMKVE